MVEVSSDLCKYEPRDFGEEPPREGQVTRRSVGRVLVENVETILGSLFYLRETTGAIHHPHPYIDLILYTVYISR